MKMNNQDMERFDRQIENMYSILVNISSELINIKVLSHYLQKQTTYNAMSGIFWKFSSFQKADF